MKLIYENDSDRIMLETSKDLTFPVHIHMDLEIFLVEEGEILVTVGNISRLLTKGDLVIVFPNQIHSYYTDPNGGSCDAILILCPASFSGAFMNILLKNHPADPFIVKDYVHPNIPYALHTLLQTPPNSPDNLPVISAFIQLVLARLLPKIELCKNHTDQSEGLIGEIISYLSEYYTEPITLSGLALKFGVSKYYISRIFNEKLHISFNNYLNTLRVDYAKILLQSSSKDILTISQMCGYENSRTFNRVFKQICACQPREYRKRKHENKIKI